MCLVIILSSMWLIPYEEYAQFPVLDWISSCCLHRPYLGYWWCSNYVHKGQGWPLNPMSPSHHTRKTLSGFRRTKLTSFHKLARRFCKTSVHKKSCGSSWRCTQLLEWLPPRCCKSQTTCMAQAEQDGWGGKTGQPLPFCELAPSECVLRKGRGSFDATGTLTLAIPLTNT